MKSLKNIGIAVVILGALATLGVMLYTSSAPEGTSDLLFMAGFYLWVMLPFAVLAGLTVFIHRRGGSPASRVGILITTILVVASSVLIYAGTILNPQTSTAPLVFVFIPLYALVAIAVAYGGLWLLLRALMPAQKA